MTQRLLIPIFISLDIVNPYIMPFGFEPMGKMAANKSAASEHNCFFHV